MQEVKSVTSGGAGEYLTGSAHLMSMSLNVQYRVRDAYTYHYRVANPVHVIDDNIRKELRRHVAGWTLDEMLNVDRAKLQTPIGDVFAKRLPGGDSALLDANETVKAGLISVNPVGDSMSAFQEVSSSQDDRERIIVNAQRLWPYPGFPARTATQPTKSSRLGAKRNGEPLPPPPRARRSTRLWAPRPASPGRPSLHAVAGIAGDVARRPLPPYTESDSREAASSERKPPDPYRINPCPLESVTGTVRYRRASCGRNIPGNIARAAPDARLPMHWIAASKWIS